MRTLGRIALVPWLALACSKGDVAATKQKLEQGAATVQQVGREGIAQAKQGIEVVQQEVTELVRDEPELSDAKLVESVKKAISCKKEQCKLPRELWHEMLERGELMSGQARTYKVEKAGKVVGVELAKLGPIPKALGFRSGDVLTDANGVPIDSVESLAKVYLELKTAETITIGYKRGKRARTKTITLS